MTRKQFEKVIDDTPKWFAIFELPEEVYEGAGTLFAWHNRSFISLKTNGNYGFFNDNDEFLKEFKNVKFVGYRQGKYYITGNGQSIEIQWLHSKEEK